MSGQSTLTNYERIKNMSIEELAKELDKIDDGGTLVCHKYKCRKILGKETLDCVSCYTDWLNEEVEE